MGMEMLAKPGQVEQMAAQLEPMVKGYRTGLTTSSPAQSKMILPFRAPPTNSVSRHCTAPTALMPAFSY